MTATEHPTQKQKVNAYLEFKLTHFLTEYDQKQSLKLGYNRYALGHYMGMVQRVRAAVDKGATWLEALRPNVCRDTFTDEFTLSPVRRFVKFLGQPEKWSVKP